MFVTKDLPPGQLIYSIAVLPLLIVMTIVGLLRLDLPNFTSIWLLFVIILPLLFAESRRPKAAVIARAQRHIEIASPMDPDAAFAKLKAGTFGKFKLRDSDERRRVLVLEAPMSGWSYGFHVPVFVRDAGIGSTIEVGIMPKVIQHATTVDEWHKRAVAEIERNLAA